jgi:hypothetical protein
MSSIPRRGRSRPKLDTLHTIRRGEFNVKVRDARALFPQLGIAADVEVGATFPGVLGPNAIGRIDPLDLKYEEGRKRFTFGELYAVQHGADRRWLTAPVEWCWYVRLLHDAGRLHLAWPLHLHQNWKAAKAAQLDDVARQVLDGVVLLDGIWRERPPRTSSSYTSLALSMRFVGPWSRTHATMDAFSDRTAFRRLQVLADLDLLVQALPPEGVTGLAKSTSYYQLAYQLPGEPRRLCDTVAA